MAAELGTFGGNGHGADTGLNARHANVQAVVLSLMNGESLLNKS
jgi:hypothetical protein